MFHDKSKHIEIKYQYIRDMVEKGAVKLQYIATDEQVADVLSKPLSNVKLGTSVTSLVWSLARGSDMERLVLVTESITSAAL